MGNEQDVMMNSFPEANDGKYFYLESEDGKQIRVTSASAAKMISSAIKNDPNLLANVNFGAKTSSELASVVAEMQCAERAVSTGDFNSFTETKNIVIVSSSIENEPYPRSKGILFVRRLDRGISDPRISQFFLSNTNGLFIRFAQKDTWTDWREI